MTRRRIFRAVWALAAGLLVAGLVWLSLRGVDLAGLAVAWRQLQFPFVLVAALFCAAVLVISALEWKLFLPRSQPLGVARLLRLTAVMVMLQNTLHHFAGQAFAVLQFNRREGLSKAAALSILAQDQIAEGFARLVLFGSLALVAAFPAWAAGGIKGVAVTVIVGYAAALAFAWRHRDYDPRQSRHASPWSWLLNGVAQWAHQLSGLRDGRITLLAVLMAVSKKCLKAAAVVCVQRSLSIDLPYYAPFLVIAVLDLATMVSIAPGHLGVFEATISFTYRYLGVDPDRALLLALVYHAAFLAAMILPGLVVVVSGWWFVVRSGQSQPCPEP